MHSRTQIRHARERWIARRKNVVAHVWNNSIGPNWWGHDGSLSKNKIHCSCKYCTEKVHNRGWTHRDTKRRMHGDFSPEMLEYELDLDGYNWYMFDEWWFLLNAWYYETYERED